MEVHPLEEVTFELLYDALRPLESSDLLELIVQAAQANGIREDDCKVMQPSTEHNKYLALDNCVVLITQDEPPTFPETIVRSAETFSARNLFPDAGETIQRHEAITTITVQKNAIALRLIEDKFGGQDLDKNKFRFSTGDEINAAVALGTSIASMITKRTSPSAVFFAPNLHILKPDTFLALAASEDPDALMIRPEVFTSGNDTDGKPTSGVTAFGSQYTIGRIVTFAPCTAPVEYMLSHVLAFVSYCRQHGELLPDGDSFGRDQHESIRLDYEDTPEGLPNRINLTLQASRELGISRAPSAAPAAGFDNTMGPEPAAAAGTDTNDLDPNDPVDAAILERLAALKSQNQPAAPENPPADTTPENPAVFGRSAGRLQQGDPGNGAETEMSAVRPKGRQAPPREKRTSIEELRKIALNAQVDAERNDKNKKSGGLGLLRGLFKKR